MTRIPVLAASCIPVLGCLFLVLVLLLSCCVPFLLIQEDFFLKLETFFFYRLLHIFMHARSLCSYYASASVFIISLLVVCVEVLRPSQPNGVISSAVSLPNHTFTGQA